MSDTYTGECQECGLETDLIDGVCHECFLQGFEIPQFKGTQLNKLIISGIQKRQFFEGESEGSEVRSESERCVSNAPDTEGGWIGRQQHEVIQEGQLIGNSLQQGSTSNTSGKRLEGRWEQGEGLPRQQNRDGCDKGRGWDKNWLEVATCLCGVDDGVSDGVDRLKLSKSRHRVERLKSLGNAIVPAVAVEIMKALKNSSIS